PRDAVCRLSFSCHLPGPAFSGSVLSYLASALSFPFLPPRPPRSTLFPYTTLFRSLGADPSIANGVDHDHQAGLSGGSCRRTGRRDRKSTRLNSSHQIISYAVFCLKKKKKRQCETKRHCSECMTQARRVASGDRTDG